MTASKIFILRPGRALLKQNSSIMTTVLGLIRSVKVDELAAVMIDATLQRLRGGAGPG